MDPLSITAAVVGLLGALTTVSKALKSIVSLISGSPHVLSSLITEINEMYMAVSVLNRLVEDIEESSTRNKSYISLEQLVATLTEAVLTVSAIEAQIKGLTGFGTSSALGVHMRTALNLPKMQTLVDRLQRNKSSLNLMFNIVQCQSNREIRNLSRILAEHTSLRLANNPDLKSRLQNVDFDVESQVASRWHADSTCNSEIQTFHESEPPALRPVVEKSGSSLQAADIGFSFDKDLEASYVYRRCSHNECDISFHTSIMRSHALTDFSRLNLSDVSAISIIALPLCSKDLTNAYRYAFGISTGAGWVVSGKTCPRYGVLNM